MNRAETVPERRRRMLGLEDGAPRNEPTDEDRAYCELIVNKVLSDQAQIRKEALAILMRGAPGAMATLMEMALGERGTSTVQFQAAVKVVEWARIAGPLANTTVGDAASGLAGVNLAELPLDQLESVLAGTLEHVRNLRAIESDAHRVDTQQERVPDIGTQQQAPTAEGQGALVLGGPAPAPPP